MTTSQIKLPTTTLTPTTRIHLQQFIQTGDKKEDLKVNVPQWKELITHLFSNNDLEDYRIITTMTPKSLEWLAGDTLSSNIEYTKSLFIASEIPTDDKCIFIDDRAEINETWLKENQYLITFQIPYPLTWDDTNLKYHPSVLETNQLAYHHEIHNEHVISQPQD